MKKTRITIVSVFGFLFALCIALVCIFGISENKPVLAEVGDADETCLWQADFTSSATLPEGWESTLFAEDGEATFTASNSRVELPLTDETKAESNNYVMEFDVQHNNSALNIYFNGLDGTNNNSLQFRLGEGSGWYGIMRLNATGHDIYTNSGTRHGVVNEKYDYNLGDAWHHVQLIHYNGYAEIWVDGLRRVVSNLESFGNNQYGSGRATVEEGTITGFAFSADNATVHLKNLKIKEAVALATDYENDVPTVNLTDMQLSARNLDNDNYRVSASYTLDGTKIGGDFYPSIRLYGLNPNQQKKLDVNDYGYSLNVQMRVYKDSDRIKVTPQAFYASEKHWIGVIDGAEDFDFAATEQFQIEIVSEVYGNHIRIYFNDKLCCEKEFGTEEGKIGFNKGHLQYITTEGCGNAACTINSTSYHAFESDSGAIVKSSADRIKAGDTITVTADLFALGVSKTWKWYDGETEITADSTVNGRTISAVLTLATGAHTITLRNGDIKSNAVSILVTEIIVGLEAEQDTIYPTDAFTFNVTLQYGEDSLSDDNTFDWYVDGTRNTAVTENVDASEGINKVFTLAGLEAGTYEVYTVYHVDSKTYESNHISVTVNEAYVHVTTDKNNYTSDETARFVATYEGISESAAENITWYVNGTEMTGTVPPEGAVDGDAIVFYLNLSNLNDTITVYCVIGEVESNTVEIFLSFDVLDYLEENENFTEVYASDFSGATAFGSFNAAEENGEQYIAASAGSQSANWSPNIGVLNGTDFAFSYKVFVPEAYDEVAYVYPMLKGLNAKYLDVWVECAFEVNATGIRPYIKDQGDGNKMYEFADYGFGQNLNWGGGIIEKGEWFEVTIALNGGYIGMYINDEMVLFFHHTNATLPSEFSMNTFNGDGISTPVRFKDFTFSIVKEPAPALTGVNISASAVTAKVGETVTLTASLVPYNAEALSISWYINGEKVTGNGLIYTFQATKAGEYKFKCVIDGVESVEKVITFAAADGSGGQQDNDPNVMLYVGLGVGIFAVIAIGGGVAFVIVKKRKNK